MFISAISWATLFRWGANIHENTSNCPASSLKYLWNTFIFHYFLCVSASEHILFWFNSLVLHPECELQKSGACLSPREINCLLHFIYKQKCFNTSSCVDWAWHFCIVNQSQMHTRRLVFIHYFFLLLRDPSLTLLQHPLFSICLYLFAHLLRRGSSSSTAGICKLSPQPSPSHSKLFACTATGVVMLRGWAAGVPVWLSGCLIFTLSGRGAGGGATQPLVGCVSRWLVCLFIANDQSQGQNCVNI